MNHALAAFFRADAPKTWRGLLATLIRYVVLLAVAYGLAAVTGLPWWVMLLALTSVVGVVWGVVLVRRSNP